MEESLEQFIARVVSSARKGNLDGTLEVSAREHVIAPILHKLGWDGLNRQIQSEYYVEGRAGGKDESIDYALFVNPDTNKDKPDIIVEAKRHGAATNNNLDQLLNYHLKSGAVLSVLADGAVWDFYLIKSGATYDEWRVQRLDLLSPSTPPKKSAGILHDLLSLEKAKSGQNIRTARELFEGGQRKKTIQNTIPRAWKQLCNDLEENKASRFSKLLNEKVAELCGYSDDEQSREFLLKNVLEKTNIPTPITAPPIAPMEKLKSPNGNKPRAVWTLFGKRHEAPYFVDAFGGIVRALHASHGGNELLRAWDTESKNAHHRHRFVVRNREEMPDNYRKRIQVGNLFVGIHTSARQQVSYLRDLCETAGIPFDDPKGLQLHTWGISQRETAIQTTENKISWTVFGKTGSRTNHSQAFHAIVKVLYERCGGDSLFQKWAGSKRYGHRGPFALITRDPDSRSPHDPIGEWYIRMKSSTAEKVSILRYLCGIAGVPFNDPDGLQLHGW